MTFMALFVRTALMLSLLAPIGASWASVGEASINDNWRSYLGGDYAAAAAALGPRAEAGDAAAQFAMGSLYCDGLAVERDYRLARSWFEKAARQNHLEAQFVLAMLLHDGVGTEGAEGALAPDLEAALPWLKVAAAGDHPMAQLLLARLYHYGKGVSRDDGRAADLALEAAKRGLAGAQFEAGILLGDRMGDREAWIEAYMWLSLAAREGHPAAAQNLEILARRLEPEEIARAKAQAGSWTPTAWNASAWNASD